MQLLEVSGAVRPIYGSLGVKRLKARSLDLSFWFHKAVPLGRKISRLFIYCVWQKEKGLLVFGRNRRQQKNSCSDSWCRTTAYRKMMQIIKKTTKSEGQNRARRTVEAILNSNQCNKIDIKTRYYPTDAPIYNS